jgi:hypothetical protein
MNSIVMACNDTDLTNTKDSQRNETPEGVSHMVPCGSSLCCKKMGMVTAPGKVEAEMQRGRQETSEKLTVLFLDLGTASIMEELSM